MCLFHPQVSQAETFKASELLEWPVESQSFYFRTSIGMAGLIARRNNAAQGECIDRWYFTDQNRSDASIRATMAKVPTYHPTGVLLAMLEKACGPLTY